MKTWVALLAAAAVLPILAGCSDPPVSPPVGVTSAVSPDRLENGTFYAFAHGGGDLAFAVASNGSADVVLYGADDERIGHIAVGAERARGRFVLDGVEAGELVVQAVAVNGTLDIRSDGSRVTAFRALPIHLERHVLVDRPPSVSGPIGFSGSSVDETLEVRLLRAPSSLSVLARATYGSLDIKVTGRSGTVYETQSGSSPFQSLGSFFRTLPGENRPENVRDGELTAHVQANSFEGILVLEAQTFSRAAPIEGRAFASADVPRFTYGVLPDQPVSFEVRAGTRLLYLWQESAGELSEECDEAANAGEERCQVGKDAHVALFDPDDVRVATVAVPANGTLALSVEASGTWVAVLLDGEATIGADLVPGDFELHPIETIETTAPAEAAGNDDGTYGQDRRDLEAAGVPYRIVPTAIRGGATGSLPNDPPAFFGLSGCDAASASVLLEGETIAAWGYGFDRYPAPITTPIDPSVLLGNGGLEIVFDDFGRGCARQGVLVTGYVR